MNCVLADCVRIGHIVAVECAMFLLTCALTYPCYEHECLTCEPMGTIKLASRSDVTSGTIRSFQNKLNVANYHSGRPRIANCWQAKIPAPRDDDCSEFPYPHRSILYPWHKAVEKNRAFDSNFTRLRHTDIANFCNCRDNRKRTWPA